jgi:hypothetical protein
MMMPPGFTPSRSTIVAMPPITIGHWARPSFSSSSGVSGASVAPKVVVFARICLMPAPGNP